MKKSLFQRFIAFTTSASLVFLQIAPQSAYAQVAADGSAPAQYRPDVNTAPNGVTQVDIVKPNATGLSHNKYNRFNVPRTGVILNNSSAATVSKLGGRILGNPNLRGNSASVILNEVTSRDPSQLLGILEVAGRSAEVVIANDNGITCNGCGFINTPRVTLTTGVPQISRAGALTGFAVDRGTINIGEDGLNATGVDYFDIISRAVQVNGAIHGKNVGIFLGRNDFNYATRVATVRADDGSTKPAFGLDSSALGGMYVDQITIVGTEAGVGVRTPRNIVTRSGGLTLTADGRIVTRNVRTKTFTKVRSKRSSVDLTGVIHSGALADIQAATSINIANNAVLASAANIQLSGENVNVNGGRVLAGVRADGSFISNVGSVAITSIDALLVAPNSKVRAGNGITLKSNDTIRVDGILDSDTSIEFDNTGSATASNIENSANLRAGTDIALKSGGTIKLLATSQVRAAADVMVTSAASLENAGLISSGQKAEIAAAQTFTNAASGLVLVGDTADLKAIDIQNDGRIVASGDALITANTFTQSATGFLGGQSALQFDLASLENAGSVIAQQNLSITASNDVENKTSGVIRSGAMLDIASKTFDPSSTALSTQAFTNAGSIGAAQSIAIKTNGQFINVGNDSFLGGIAVAGVASTPDLTLMAGTVSNSGRIDSNQTIITASAGNLTNDNTAFLISRGDLSLIAKGDFINAANANVAGLVNVTLASDGQINQAGTLQANGNLVGSGSAITSSGNLLIGGTTDLTSVTTIALGGNTDFSGNAVLAAATNLSLSGELRFRDGQSMTAQSLTNSGNALFAKSLNLTLANTFNNSGVIQTNEDIALNVSGIITQSGTLRASGRFDVNAGDDANISGALEAGTDLAFAFDKNLTITSMGRLAASGTADLVGKSASSKTLDNKGTIASGGALTITNQTGPLAYDGSLALLNDGTIASGDAVSIALNGSINLAGTIEAATTLAAQFGGSLISTTTSRLIGQTGLTLENTGAAGAIALGGSTGSNSTVNIAANGSSLSNSGSLLSGGLMALTSDAAFTNSGSIETADALSVTSSQFTSSGSVRVGNDLTLQTGGRISVAGLIEAGGVLTAHYKDNFNVTAAGRFVGATSVAISNTGGAGQFANAGTIGSSNGLTLNGGANTFDNSGIIIAGTTGAAQFGGNAVNSGQMQFEEAFTLAANQLSNSGSIFSEKAVTINTVGQLNSAGQIESKETLQITYADALTVGTLGKLVGQTGLTITNSGAAGAVSNSGIIGSSAQMNLQLANASLTNAGTLFSARDMMIALTGTLNNSGTIKGENASLSADVSILTPQSITNSGAIGSTSDLTIVTSGGLSSAGIIEATGNTNVTFAGNLSVGAAGRLVGQNALTLTNSGGSGTIRNAGTTGSQGDVTIAGGAANFVNSGSLVSSADSAITIGGTFDNSGSLQTDGTLSLVFAKAFTNSGILIGKSALGLDYTGTARGQFTNGGTLGTLGSIILANSNLNIANTGSIAAKDDIKLAIAGNFSNSGTVRADRLVELASNQFNNSGTLESASEIDIAFRNDFTNGTGGQINSGATLTLDYTGAGVSNFTNNGTISAVNSIALLEPNLKITNNGLFVSAANLSINSNQALSNTGRINAVGNLQLVTTAALSNTGSGEIVSNGTTTTNSGSLINGGLISGDTVSVNVAGNWTATGGEMSAGSGAVNVNLGGNFNNTSVFTASGNFVLTAGTITNSSAIVAGGDLTLIARGNFTNSDLILADGGLTIRTNGTILNDHAVLLSTGALRLIGRTNQRAAKVTNLAGLIESDGAGVEILANAVDNLSDPVTITPDVQISSVVGAPSVSGNTTTTITTTIFEDRFATTGSSAQILSAGNMIIRTGALRNHYSQIAAGNNLVLEASSVDNLAVDLNRTTRTETKRVTRVRYCSRRILGFCVRRKTRYDTVNSVDTATALYDRKTSAITAVNTVQLNVSGAVTNRQDIKQGAVSGGLSANTILTNYNLPSGGAGVANASVVNNSGGTGTSGSGVGSSSIVASLGTSSGGNETLSGLGAVSGNVSGNGGLPQGFTVADLGSVNLDNPNTLYAALATVTNDTDVRSILTQANTAFGRLFVPAAPDASVVFETRFRFTDLGTFLGSDYFLQKLNIPNGDTNIRRLGDAYFDTRFIKDQILKLTGLRFLDPNYLNDTDQMRALIDNAAEISGELSLSYGVALTVEQQQALTKDIVWYEKQLVGGRETLVPRLYLANGPRPIGPGALIAGTNVNVNAGAIDNLRSTIRATDQLTLVSTGDILSFGGLLSGGSVNLNAGGSVKINTQVASLTSDGGRTLSTVFGGTSSVLSDGDLFITAGDGFEALGSNLSAGGNLSLDISGSAEIAAIEDFKSSDGGSVSFSEQKLFGSSLEAGEKLQIIVGENLTVLASDISAGDDASIRTGGNFALLAGEQLSTFNQVTEKSGFFSSKTTTVDEARLTHQSSSITTGGDLTLTVGEDALIAGSDLKAEGTVDVLTGGELIATSVVDSYIKSTRVQKCSFFCLFGSDKSTSVTQLVNQGSTAEAQADLIARSGGSTTLIASTFEAGNDLTIRAGAGEDANPEASINIIAAQDVLNQATREEEWGLFSFKSGTFFVTYNEENTETTTQTTNVSSQVLAGGNVNLDAAQDINITGSQVEALGDARLTADRDVNIIAAREVATLEQTSELSGLGVSLSVSGGGISLFAGYSEDESGINQTSDRSSGTLVSAGNDLVIVAGQDINQVGSDLVASNDISLDAGRNINSLAATDVSTLDEYQRSLRVGITASLNSSGLASVNQAVNGARNFGAGEGGGIYEAATNLAAASNVVIGVLSPLNNFAQGYGQAGIGGGTAGGIDRALGLNVSVSFGVSGSESESSSVQDSARPSTIIAGGDLTLVADERIHFEGTQAQAIGDIRLTADEIFIESAQSGGAFANETSSFNASIGLSAGVSTQTGIGSFGPTASIGASESDQTRIASTNVNSVIASGGELSITTTGDLGIEGGNLSGNTVDIDVGGNLDVITRQDTSETDGSSRGFNLTVSTTSASGGVNGSETVGDRAWSVPSTINSEGRLQIVVGNETLLRGSAIISETDDLLLRTSSLNIEDLDDRDFFEREGGGINLGSGAPSIVTGISFDYERIREEGITRATIGGGTVEIGDMSQEEAQELLDTANRDPEAFREVFLSEHVKAVGDVDVQGLFELPEMAQNVGNLLEAFATPVPDDVKAAGRENVDYFRRLIVNGLTAEEARSEMQTEQVQELVGMQQSWNRAIDQFGSALLVPEDVRALILAGQDVYFDAQGNANVSIAGCETSGPNTGCIIRASALNVDLASVTEVAEARLKALVAEQLSITEGGIVNAFRQRAISQQIQQFLELYIFCADDYTDLSFMGPMGNDPRTASWIEERVGLRITADYLETQTSIIQPARAILNATPSRGEDIYQQLLSLTSLVRDNGNTRLIEAAARDLSMQLLRGTKDSALVSSESYDAFIENSKSLSTSIMESMSPEQRSAYETGVIVAVNTQTIFDVTETTLGVTGIKNILGIRSVATTNTTLTQIDDYIDITANRRTHILNGHLSGAGKSGKTEFPSNWDADRIMHQVSDVATDPNATRGLGKWDSPYAVATRDGIEIRVDFYPDLLPNGLPHPNAGKISTAYPTNTPVNP